MRPMSAPGLLIQTVLAAAIALSVVACSGGSSPSMPDTGSAMEETLIESAQVGIASAPTCAAVNRRVELLVEAVSTLSEDRQRAELDEATEAAAKILPDCELRPNTVDTLPAEAPQLVDSTQADIAAIRESVLNGYCDPGSGVCYDSFADQAGAGVTVDDFSCVSAGGRTYECIIKASDANGEFTASITGSCDNTGCIWRTQ